MEMAYSIIKLIRKDFYALWIENRVGLTLLIISTAISAFFAPVGGIIWLFFMFINIYAIIMSLFRLDEKYRTEGFFASFPVSRREIVFSRYGVVIVIFIIYMIVTYLLDVSDILNYGKPIKLFIPAGYYITLFLSLAILSSFILPFYFNQGYARGKGLGILIIIILWLCVGYIRHSYEFREVLYTKTLFSFHITTSLTLLGISVLLLGLSILVTVTLYSRKEL